MTTELIGTARIIISRGSEGIKIEDNTFPEEIEKRLISLPFVTNPIGDFFQIRHLDGVSYLLDYFGNDQLATIEVAGFSQLDPLIPLLTKLADFKLTYFADLRENFDAVTFVDLVEEFSTIAGINHFLRDVLAAKKINITGSNDEISYFLLCLMKILPSSSLKTLNLVSNTEAEVDDVHIIGIQSQYAPVNTERLVLDLTSRTYPTDNDTPDIVIQGRNFSTPSTFSPHLRNLTVSSLQPGNPDHINKRIGDKDMLKSLIIYPSTNWFEFLENDLEKHHQQLKVKFKVEQLREFIDHIDGVSTLGRLAKEMKINDKDLVSLVRYLRRHEVVKIPDDYFHSVVSTQIMLIQLSNEGVKRYGMKAFRLLSDALVSRFTIKDNHFFYLPVLSTGTHRGLRYSTATLAATGDEGIVKVNEVLRGILKIYVDGLSPIMGVGMLRNLLKSVRKTVTTYQHGVLDLEALIEEFL